MTQSRPIAFLSALLLTSAAFAADAKPYNIRDFGAAGDGKTKDTAALQKALDACAVNGGGEVLVPAGTYLIGSVQMGTRTTLRLEKDAVLTGSGDAADYPSMDIRWEGRWQPGRRALIYAGNVDHIAILGPKDGTAKIEGNPAMAQPQNPRGSVVLEPINCTDVRWENLTITQGGNWATHPTYCTDVTIKNLTIKGNRDGIDVDSCKNVTIDSCDLDCGDDCVSLKSGRGLNGARVGKPVEDVTITNCTMRGRNFACIGIGSEISAGVKNIKIDNCKLTSRTFAVYIKSRIGRAGVTENLAVSNLDVLGGGFLKINLLSAGNTNTADDPVEGPAGIPSARNLAFTNIRLAEAATTLAEVYQIPSEKPLENLTLANISGTAKTGMKLQHLKDAKLSNISVTVASGPLLTAGGVTGTGLENAAPLPPSAK